MVVGITPDEVCKALERIGANVSRRVLLDYEKAGLIPIPERRGGKYTNYPPVTVEEAFAAWSLLRGKFNNELLDGIIHTVPYGAISIARANLYRNGEEDDMILTARQHAKSVAERKNEGWKCECDYEPPTPEDQVIDIQEAAVSKMYYGIQLLWLSECYRARILLKSNG